LWWIRITEVVNIMQTGLGKYMLIASYHSCFGKTVGKLCMLPQLALVIGTMKNRPPEKIPLQFNCKMVVIIMYIHLICRVIEGNFLDLGEMN
jgi:hypothetical protein